VLNRRLQAAALVAACSLATLLLVRGWFSGSTAAEGSSMSETTSPDDGGVWLLPAEDPDASPPRVRIEAGETSVPTTLLTFEWLVGGKLTQEKEPALVRWPSEVDVSSASPLQVLVFSKAAPQHVEVRIFDAGATDVRGAPSTDPIGTVVCRRTPQQPEHACLRREDRGHFVELPALAAGSYKLAIFASWLPPPDYWRRQGAAGDPGDLFASWLAAFRVVAPAR
jgi:hypothetical protein